jgi:hypothetical protein
MWLVRYYGRPMTTGAASDRYIEAWTCQLCYTETSELTFKSKPKIVYVSGRLLAIHW